MIHFIVVKLLAALAFMNSGFLPQVENRSVFLTQVARRALLEETELKAATLDAAMQHAINDEERAEAFVSWLSAATDHYVAKIREKEDLPFMITYDLVVGFFCDAHVYKNKTREEWESIIRSFDMSVLSLEDQKIFQSILVPYLKEAPSVEHAYRASKRLYHVRLSDPEFKERVKALFSRIGLPFFAWRLDRHMKHMNENPYLVARAERVIDYIVKRYQKEKMRFVEIA